MTKPKDSNGVEQESIPLMAGIGAQKYALMAGRNYSPKRDSSGAISASEQGSTAYPAEESGQAFPDDAAAF